MSSDPGAGAPPDLGTPDVRPVGGEPSPGGVAQTSESTPSRRGGLFRHRDFRRLFLGHTSTSAGLEFTYLAIPILAVQVLGANAFQMGVIGALQTAAFLVLSLPAGAWVDRWRKKRVLVCCDLARALLLATLPVAWLLDVLTIGQVFVVVAAVGCLTVFFDVAAQSYLPEIVESDAIAEGNGKLQAAHQVVAVGGPSAAAWVIRVIGAPLTLVVTAVGMALSAVFVSRIEHEEESKPKEGRRPLRHDVMEGLRFVRGNPLLVRITSTTGISNFSSAGLEALMVLYVLQVLGLSEAALGLVFSLGAIGGLIGAFTAARLSRIVGEGRIIPASSAVFAIAALNVPLASTGAPLAWLIGGTFLVSWSVVVYNITQVSFRQRLCPKPLLGRMNASIRFLVWGPMPLGALVGGLLGTWIGIVPALWVIVGVGALSVLPVLLSPLCTMRELPRSMDALSRT